MKINITHIIIIGLVAWIILQNTCNEPNNTKELTKENKVLQNKLKTKEKEKAILSHITNELKSNYNILLNKKDSVIERTKTLYLTVYDTIQNKEIECLPKIYVDSIIFSQDSINKVASKRFYTDSLIIDNLETQNKIKDTIISNDSLILDNTKKQLRKERRKKWKFLFLGVISGYVAGKSF